MDKIVSAQEAVSKIKDGDKVMVGGFLACGAAENLLDEMVEQKKKDIKGVVICTDFVGRGIGKLIDNKILASLQTSHIGTNKETQAQYNAGELDIEFIPQGSLMERVRAGGAGIGGILTKTGLGTLVAEGKQVITVEGEEFLLEPAIKGDVAVIKAKKADKFGNLVFDKTSRSSNPIMATACKITIVEADEIVEIGELNNEDIITSGVFVDYIVQSKGQ